MIIYWISQNNLSLGIKSRLPASAAFPTSEMRLPKLLVEYAETAARYELECLRLGSPTQGLTDEQLLQLCKQFGIDPNRFV